VSWLGKERVHLASCGSTSDEAMRLAKDGAPHGTVITADAQTAGRGRAGRRWHSPPGRDLYFSAILRPALAPAAVPAITLAAGVGTCDAVRAAGVDGAAIKWPNDIVVGEPARKLAGILTEMTTRGASLDAVILGIGVDVGSTAADRPDELAAIATSIREQAGDAPAVEAFATSLCAALEPWLERYFTGGVAAITAAWHDRARLGTRVLADGRRGVALGLDDDGALRVGLDDGDVIRVVAGDVVEIAPEPTRS
jgi:BirA family biotin operon repressor/biotin-[acetyl-CoA-carboxylase] ligase